MTSACCAFVFRTGQCVCGRWTATAVRCTVWLRAPTTLMLWAPSAAPGNIFLQSHARFLSRAPTQLSGKCSRKKGDCHSKCVLVCRMKASFIVSGSQDCTVKVWDLPADLSTTGADIHLLTARATEKAHDKVQAQNLLQIPDGMQNRETCLQLTHVCTQFS